MSERISRLQELYGGLPIEELLLGTEKIRKKLGGLRFQQIVKYLQEKNHLQAAKELLHYYDSAYETDQILAQKISLSSLSPQEWAKVLIERSIQ